MTNLYRRLGALLALGVTAGVSLLAGGVLLGTASADEPVPAPAKAANKAFTIAYRGEAMAGGNGDTIAPSCTISYRVWSPEDGAEPPLPALEAREGAKIFSSLAFAPGDIEEAIASGKIKVLEAGDVEDFAIAVPEGGFGVARRVELKPGEEPRVFEFKAGELPKDFAPGKMPELKPGELPEGFTPIDPSNCTVIGEDGEITLPNGTKVAPTGSLTIP